MRSISPLAPLGVERSKLTHRRFAGYIAPADSDRWRRDEVPCPHGTRLRDYGSVTMEWLTAAAR